MTAEAKPVLIVGAGPTGMTAAMELARFGISVRLIEKKTQPDKTSRAIGVQARTLELFEQRGLADEMLKVGHKGVAGSIYGGGKRVFRQDFSHVDSRYNYLFFISQAETERILRERLALQGVEIEWDVEMIVFAQEESSEKPGQSGGITATLRRQNGLLEEVEALYLVSAEGAHSTVRRSLGLEFQGKTLEENYALGDFYLDGDLADTDFHIFSSEHGFMGLFPMGQRRFRMIASNPLSQPSKDTELALEELQKIYDMRSHIPGRLRDMSWSGWFRINSRMINHLQQRRVFLGGDAAHIHSPAGAQGMNTGIQDMINLCWKLAMVIHGKASPKLLDTYGEDRIPAIRNVLTKTEGLTAAIGSENPVFRTIFNHVAPLVVGTEFVQEKSAARMSQVALNYRESSLSETHGHHRSLRAGDRVPDMTLRVMNKAGSAEQAPREVCLFSLLDPSRFTLFYINVDDPAELHAEIQAKLAAWRSFIDGYQIAPVESNAVENKHFTSVFGSSPGLVLMRPDSYVGFMGEADSVPHLAAYLQKWFAPEGKRPPRPTREPNMQNPSRLDPTDVQLLFADLQTQIVARSKTTDPKALRMAARVLAQLAKVFSLPVTISTVPEGEHAPELIPELAKEAVGAPQFLRTGASPFLDERTKMALNSHGRKTLVICGVATEVVVLHAATAAIEAGYRALVPVDACGGMSERTESAALRQIEAFGGEVTSTVTMATALAPDFETVLGQQMFAVVQQLRLA